MTPQELKASILQLAIQGKLVEQRSEEGTGEELFQQIQTEKQALIKAGKIKKEKPLSEITEDEIPFDIPESWKWIRLGEIASINGGFAFKSTNYTADGVRVIRISDFNEQGFVDDKIVRYPYDELLSQYVLDVKNILLCMTGGTVGKSLFVTHMNEKMVVNQRVATIKVETVLPEYVYQVILAPITQKVIQHSKNSTNDNISMDTIKDFLIPLPSLSEQNRIVAKIEELLPYIERYEQAWSKLEDFNKRFPVDMQKSILQTAIQGKLVEQRPEEGTGEELLQQIQTEKQALIKAGKIKKEKPLPEIVEDEIPFDIPDTWKWVSVGSVCVNIQYGSSQKSSITGKVPVLRMGNIQNGRLVWDKLVYTTDDEEIAKYPLQYDDLLFNRTNSKELVGKTAIYKGEFPAIYAGYLVRVTPLLMCSDYLNYVMQSQFYWSYCQTVRSDAIGQSNINAEKLKRFVFPLPPLAEQKRIVAKLEEILPLCERLK